MVLPLVVAGAPLDDDADRHCGVGRHVGYFSDLATAIANDPAAIGPLSPRRPSSG
jgi:hypothetical protein